MLTVEQAQHEVLARAKPLPAEPQPLGPALPGLVLAEDVASDIDSPPFRKSMVDGYAITADDLNVSPLGVAVVEEIPAGRAPAKTLLPGQTARIMTGAMLPDSAAAVVMLERTETLPGDVVRILESPIRPGQNILKLGQEMRVGDVVLKAGAVLRPQELGILASVGRTSVNVFRRPRVAVLSTGDEIVEPSERPGPAQIRNSNAALLCGQIARAGGTPHYLGIARDTLESLRPLVDLGLSHDVLVLSGGVSAGKLDLVPEVLRERGVLPAFHKVHMKPGKPLFFGVAPHPRPLTPDPSPPKTGERGEERNEDGGEGGVLVFGLPGNPVSSLVGFELFVRPALRALLGRSEPHVRLIPARLAIDFRHKSDRPTYHPARLEFSEEGLTASPVPWFGSADLRSISQANGFAVLPAEERSYPVGELIDVVAMDLDWSR
jgi:molybdopterin molybdotransferase